MYKYVMIDSFIPIHDVFIGTLVFNMKMVWNGNKEVQIAKYWSEVPKSTSTVINNLRDSATQSEEIIFILHDLQRRSLSRNNDFCQ